MRRLWAKYRYLFFRRTTQIAILVLYFGANAWGWTLLMGNLSSSSLLGIIPLSDPYAVLQMFVAGASIATDIALGALIITIFYLSIGGRAFCSWVCPVNLITDAAALLRRKIGVENFAKKQPATRDIRYWVLAISLIVSAIMGVAAFELISPISMFHRGVVFGMGFGWAALIVIFLFDLLVLKNGWCGHVCPLGGFYSLVGKNSLIRVYHTQENCTECMKCKVVCPEQQVLYMIGKESMSVTSAACTNCGRCVEVCDDDALEFSIRKFAKQGAVSS
ncbi:MAG: quinol dehydrogenase ferredoxin subunit NapH [Sulfurimonas sp.]|jgi:ferredoxin-type protein NapH|nr:quinol dehydrogenase ferredoxin subunit NapH [Sulfurimonadaceae bacterium]